MQSLKNVIEKLCPTCQLIVSNIIYRSDTGKASLTGKNINFSNLFLFLEFQILKSKFEMLRKIAKDKLGILLISDTKVNPSFPSSQFEIVGFSSTFQFDRNTSGGIMLFVQREISSKLLSKYKPNGSFENIFIEIKLRSKKWFLSYSYNPNLTILNNHTQNIIRSLDF